MIIELRKFGKILTSRESGREARAAFLPTLSALAPDEKIEIDFQGVAVLTPSWADEFIIPLKKNYKRRVVFLNTDNPSVMETFRTLEPKLDLNGITVFEDKLVFDEKIDSKLYDSGKAVFVPTFPCEDDDAVQMLIDAGIKHVSLFPVDGLKKERLEQVVLMLKNVGIESRNGFSRV